MSKTIKEVMEQQMNLLKERLGSPEKFKIMGTLALCTPYLAKKELIEKVVNSKKLDEMVTEMRNDGLVEIINWDEDLRITQYSYCLPAIYMALKHFPEVKEYINRQNRPKGKSLETFAAKVLNGEKVEIDESFVKNYYEMLGPFAMCTEVKEANISNAARQNICDAYVEHALVSQYAEKEDLDEMHNIFRQYKLSDFLKSYAENASNKYYMLYYMATGENIAPEKTYAHTANQAMSATLSGNCDEGAKLFGKALKERNKLYDDTADKNHFGISTVNYIYCYSISKASTATAQKAVDQYIKKRSEYLTAVSSSGAVVCELIGKHENVKNVSYYLEWSTTDDWALQRYLRTRLYGEASKAPEHINLKLVRHEMQNWLPMDEEERAELNKTFGDSTCMGDFRVKEDWEVALEQATVMLKSTKEKSCASKEGKQTKVTYYVDEEYPDEEPMKARRHTLSKLGEWSKGAEIKGSGLKKIAESLDEIDQKIAQMVKQYYYYGAEELPYLSECAHLFVGSTNKLFATYDGMVTPLRVVEEKAYLETARRNNLIEISSNVTKDDLQEFEQKPCIIKIEGDVMKVVRMDKAQRELMNVLLTQRRFPKKAEPMLREVLTQTGTQVEVHSDMVEGGSTLETVKGDSTLVMQITSDGLLAYTIRVKCQPLKGGHQSYVPGQGGKTIYDEAEGVRYQVTRTLRTEKANLATLQEYMEEELELSLDEKSNHLETTLVVHDLLDVLNFARQNSDKMAVEWPEGQKLKVSTALSDSNITMDIRSSGIGWFDVSGQATLDNGTLLTMSMLLEGLRKGEKGYIRLGDNEFVQLTDSLSKTLEKLEAMAESNGDNLKVNTLQVGELAEVLKSDMAVTTDKEFESLNKKMRDSMEMEVEMPATLQAELRDYQQTGYEWMTRRTAWGAGVCLADDMGLGKTLQTITFLLSKATEGASLVVAPASVMANWKREVEKFAPTLKVTLLNHEADRKKTIDEAGDYDIVICTYGLLVTEEETLCSRTWNTICLDEAHTIKNRTTKMSASAMKLKGNNRIMLTGTPIQNHLGELWNLFQFINPGLLGTYEEFDRKFILPIENDRKSLRQKQLKRMVQPFMLRRTKSEVVDELPDKTEVVRTVELMTDERAAYELYRQKAMDEMNEANSVNVNVLSEITRLREMACSVSLVEKNWHGSQSKIAAFLALAENIVGGGNKILVFSQFTKFLEMVGKALTEAGMEYCQLDGSTPIKKREKLVEEFQHGKHPIFLISLKAGGLGLNLTEANYVVLLDPWWNPAIEQQATDRAHRIGQKHKVTVYRLIAEGTIEEKMLDMHKSKKDLADSLMEGSNMTHKLSLDELKAMLVEGQKE